MTDTTSNVIELHGPDTILGDGIALAPETVLDGATQRLAEGGIEQAIVLLTRSDGGVDAFASHGRRDALLTLTLAQHRLITNLNSDYED